MTPCRIPNSRDHFQSSILSPPAADLIATSAINLENTDLAAQSKFETPGLVRIPPSQIAKAYEIHLMNLKARNEWIDEENKAGKQAGKQDKNPQENIVDRVMKSGLSNYEKKLVGCIVKPGTHILFIRDK
jgi:hypothetical protein